MKRNTSCVASVDVLSWVVQITFRLTWLTSVLASSLWACSVKLNTVSGYIFNVSNHLHNSRPICFCYDLWSPINNEHMFQQTIYFMTHFCGEKNGKKHFFKNKPKTLAFLWFQGNQFPMEGRNHHCPRKPRGRQLSIGWRRQPREPLALRYEGGLKLGGGQLEGVMIQGRNV